MRRFCSTLALAAFVWLGSAAWATPLARVTLPAEDEPARPGDAGVVIRIEGSRRGGSIRQVASTLPPGLHPGSHAAELVPGEAVVEVSDPDPDPEPVSARLQLRSPPARRNEPALAARLARTAAIPIRLLIGRQNE